MSEVQPEFKTPIWDYLAGLVDEERVNDGRAMMARWGQALALAQSRFGVDPATVTAVWGVESDYGRSFGTRPVVQSLATLACGGRRAGYFRSELFAALKIIQHGDIDPAQFNGSWAGAFGHTQFMPSTFLRVAVDLDGDGRKDLINSVPDALGSTANYLRKGGWVPGGEWGFEVRLPEHYAGPSGRTRKQPMAAWAARGRYPHRRRAAAGRRERGAAAARRRQRARRFSSPAISMRSIPIMRRNPMRWRSRFCPTGCAGGTASSRHGRRTTLACRAPTGARCKRCS